MREKLDCRKCGACCAPETYGHPMREQEGGYVQLFLSDLLILSPFYRREHVVWNTETESNLRGVCD